MSDYTSQGAAPVEDAAVDDPPTVDEVLERQRTDYPEQAATSTQQPGNADDVEAAAVAAGGHPTGEVTDGHPEVEGPNSQ